MIHMRLRMLQLPALIGMALTVCAMAGDASAQGRKERYCEEYAEQAVAAASRNVRDRCGYRGPRWIVDANPHRFYCLIVPENTTEAETEGRRADLLRCADRGEDRERDMDRDRDRRAVREPERTDRTTAEGKRASCDTYAKMAVVQVDANAQFRCDFRGPQWTRSYNAHFDWCGHVRRSTLVEELRNRAGSLQQCFDRLGDYDDDRWERR